MDKVRIFICLPMTGRDNEEVLDDIEKMSDVVKDEFSKKLQIARHKIITQHNFNASKPPLGTKVIGAWYLQNSMKIMSYVNALVFHPNWESSNGSKIEKFVADIYNIPQIFLTYDSQGFHMPKDDSYMDMFK